IKLSLNYEAKEKKVSEKIKTKFEKDKKSVVTTDKINSVIKFSKKKVLVAIISKTWLIQNVKCK
ncbi:hypothetical protein, partial [Liquorilactobacillus vini]|uniref:hypothetical protein n=1 Tax=Liquorilactobacillus vini TaxID=238015 RepID=UPI000557E665